MVEGHQCHRVAHAHRGLLMGHRFKAHSPNKRFVEGQPCVCLNVPTAAILFSFGCVLKLMLADWRWLQEGAGSRHSIICREIQCCCTMHMLHQLLKLESLHPPSCKHSLAVCGASFIGVAVTQSCQLCASAGAAAISGKTLSRIEVHGKQLFYFFGEGADTTVMQIHFGMSGAFRTMPVANPREARETTRLVLENTQEGLLAHLSAMTVQHGDLGGSFIIYLGHLFTWMYQCTCQGVCV